jgi:mannose-6-phosphate isomerase-like protein (cupin superfamily)
MKFRDQEIWIEEGEMIVIPTKVEHMPVASEKVHELLFEPKSTKNTGNVIEEKTRTGLEKI